MEAALLELEVLHKTHECYKQCVNRTKNTQLAEHWYFRVHRRLAIPTNH
jgi:hypothetical protein